MATIQIFQLLAIRAYPAQKGHLCYCALPSSLFAVPIYPFKYIVSSNIYTQAAIKLSAQFCQHSFDKFWIGSIDITRFVQHDQRLHMVLIEQRDYLLQRMFPQIKARVSG